MLMENTRRLLLCQIAFESFAGSEMVALELIEWFASQGWHVDLSTTVVGEPMESEAQPLIDQGSLRILSRDDLDSVRAEHYDLMWLHHSLLPRAIAEQLATSAVTTPMVWHHLSSFQPLGLPLLYEAEDELASIITCMAPVARDRVREFGFDRHRIELFDNPAPEEFCSYETRQRSTRLSSLLIVSNHPPSEVRAAAEMLVKDGVTVVIAGVGEQYARLRPHHIDGHDAVLTIGKSTQYALVMGVPVYSYDHFGGGGWITASNIDNEWYGNFAGRIERRVLVADKIVDELVSGFAEASQFAHDYRPRATERWSLTRKLRALLDDDRMVPRERSLTEQQSRRVALLCEERDYMWRELRRAHKDVGELLELIAIERDRTQDFAARVARLESSGAGATSESTDS